MSKQSRTCPYCGERVSKLPNHLPCNDVPDTEVGR